ncbi:hypothetical protein F2Q70_00009218 [Brassica cretica]|uniref:Uncharacterized protein n=1 Tax=Brassica cretica TaxID=69181 RepID=A0A8S9JMK7_BRACR|nr:hypothetical protein F2Q68_00002315 [Brassica cretica]KAF2610480.1 hypothetical protein F2Q70_00009218 [Brassica cretica]
MRFFSSVTYGSIEVSLSNHLYFFDHNRHDQSFKAYSLLDNTYKKSQPFLLGSTAVMEVCEPSDVSTGIVEGAQSEQENGLGFVKLWVFTVDHFKKISMVMNLKYVDPAYMIRTVSTNASNTVYFRLLAQSVVHGAVAGYTSYISSLINRRQTYIPYSRITYKQNNVVITDRVWTRLMS